MNEDELEEKRFLNFSLMAQNFRAMPIGLMINTLICSFFGILFTIIILNPSGNYSIEDESVTYAEFWEYGAGA